MAKPWRRTRRECTGTLVHYEQTDRELMYGPAANRCGAAAAEAALQREGLIQGPGADPKQLPFLRHLGTGIKCSTRHMMPFD